jgi:hypothetical protein
MIFFLVDRLTNKKEYPHTNKPILVGQATNEGIRGCL